MNKLLLSINPEHVKNIINGTKTYEYRTVCAKREISSIYIYETYPTKKVVAEAEVLEILKMKPDELWNLTKDESGISKEFFDKYFENRAIAYAYKLGKITVFEQHKELSEFGVKTAPQSFVYV